MNNKERIFSGIADLLTPVLLVCAFGVAYYTGFYSGTLNTTLFAALSSLGLLAMFVVGPVSELVSRIKRNTVTKSFLGGFISQLACVILMAVFMILGALSVIPLNAAYIKVLYVVFVLAVVFGFCRSIAYTNIVEKQVGEVEEVDEVEGE